MALASLDAPDSSAALRDNFVNELAEPVSEPQITSRLTEDVAGTLTDTIALQYTESLAGVFDDYVFKLILTEGTPLAVSVPSPCRVSRVRQNRPV